MEKPITDTFLFVKSMINILESTSHELSRHIGSGFAQTEDQNKALNQLARADINLKKTVKDLKRAINNFD